MKSFAQCINAFSSYVNISSSSTPTLYTYLETIYNECIAQYGDSTNNSLPLLYDQSLFPNVYNYFGTSGTSDAAKESLIGWCIALILTEIRPKKRNSILQIGYELGGYTKSSQLYGYSFKNDPMIARLVAGAIYTTMRGKLSPDMSTMKTEIGSSSDGWNWGFQSGYDTSSTAVGESDFYIDFRNFMPTAPGPNNSSSIPDSKDGYNNIQVDRDIHENIIVSDYNLDSGVHQQETAQAISDKDMEVEHYFGSNTTVLGYTIRPIFSNYLKSTRVERTEGFGKFMHWTTRTGMAARKILQGTSDYKRFRPGCSWSNTREKNSTSDDRRNALANFDIEDSDGSKEWYENGSVIQYYYDESGNWTSSSIRSASDYKNSQQTSLQDNSYPSGHSSGIWCVGQTLMELYPNQADNIMQDCNRFAIERTICRYHWTSDTIIGRVLGSAINAVLHATSDYDTIKGGNYNSLSNLTALPSGGSSSGSSTTGEDGDGIIGEEPDETPSSERVWSASSLHTNTNPFNATGNTNNLVTLGTLINVPSTYPSPTAKAIYIKIDYVDIDNTGSYQATSGSMLKLSSVTFTNNNDGTYDVKGIVLNNGNSQPRKIHLFVAFTNPTTGVEETDYLSLWQRAGDGSGNSQSSEINYSLGYSIGGYGSCHVDPNENSLVHYCTKEAITERHPSITVNQRVNFTISGAGVTTENGSTSGVWEADTPYNLICPAIGDGEDQVATITMSNSNGKRILYYTLSKNGTHDDGTTPSSGTDPGIDPGPDTPVEVGRPSIDIEISEGNITTVSMASSIESNGRETDIPWGGVGSSSSIRYKRDIIDWLIYAIKPIKDINLNGLSYNIITSYAYFHNDVCYDLKDLWNHYKIIYDNYKDIKDFYDDIKTWYYDNEYKITDFNNNISGQTLYDGTTEDHIGMPINIYFDNLPELPTIDEFNTDDIYEEYTYTWLKDSTYSMPYKMIGIPERISYDPNIQVFWQALSYSALKWKNNRYENHTALIM